MKVQQFSIYEVLRHDKSTVRLLGQAISVERKAPKIGNSNEFSNGFTPHLHLLKVNYPMNDESTLHNAGRFFPWID